MFYLVTWCGACPWVCSKWNWSMVHVIYGFFSCPCFLLFTDWVPVACRFRRDAHSSTCNPTNQLTHPNAVTLFSAPSSISPTAAQNWPLASVFLLPLWSLPVFCYQPWLLTPSCYWVAVWPLLPQKKSTCCVSFRQLSSWTYPRFSSDVEGFSNEWNNLNAINKLE